MKNIFISVLILVSTFSKAQVTSNFKLIIPEIVDSCNTTVDVPIKVKDFKDIISLQFSLGWDTSKLIFSSISNFGPASLGLSNNLFGLTNVSNGDLRFSWFDENLSGETLADSTAVFTVRFTIKNKVSGFAYVRLQDSPISIEVVDTRYEAMTYSTVNGRVNISCLDPTALNLLLPTFLDTCKTEASVPVRVKNFNDLQSLQFSVTWDTSKLSCKGLDLTSSPADLSLQLSNFGFNDTLNKGSLAFLWYNNNVNFANGITLPDSTILFYVKYLVKGKDGDETYINITDSAVVIEAVDKTLNTIDVSSNTGVLKIRCDDCEFAFTVNDTTQCLTGNTFSFTPSSNKDLATLSYLWNFGDASNATLQNPTHTYATSGTFNVKLIATTPTGCKDSSIVEVTVSPMPIAAFSINDTTQCVVNNNFVFTNLTSLTGGGGLTYLWRFGDGDSSTTTNPSHVYDTAGTYTVKLISTSASGCKDSTTINVKVTGVVTAKFSINDTTQCLTGNSFEFTNTSTVSGSNLTYLWKFGDGTTNTAKNPTHTYLDNGTYIVTLIATSTEACSDSSKVSVIVNPMPKAKFSINDTTQVFKDGNNFIYTNLSTLSGSGSMTYLWKFGDGNTDTATNPTHVYDTTGFFLVKMIATSTEGCSDSVIVRDTVLATAVAKFGINDSIQCLRGNNFIFSDSSTIDGGTISYKWYFGDGSTSSIPNPSYAYLTADTFDVKLVVKGTHGGLDSIVRRVYVNPMPVASFSINDSVQCLNGNSFVFNNLSTVPLPDTLRYLWNFGDGKIDSILNPIHVYDSARSYLVKLITTSTAGCVDSSTVSILVAGSVVAGFTVSDTVQCFKENTFSFTNTSSTTPLVALKYLWDFGDGKTDSILNPIHSYDTSGFFDVQLIASNVGGCADTFNVTIKVYPTPIAGFSVNDTIQTLLNNEFIFTNLTKIDSGSMKYRWSFGDSTFSDSLNPVHTYTSAGTYTVTLISIADSSICADTSELAVHVIGTAIPKFFINDSVQCLTGNLFEMIDSSTVDAGELSYLWDFGDQYTSTLNMPTHSYADSGTYTIKLIVRGSVGGLDSMSREIRVEPMPRARFIVNDTGQCFKGNNFVLTDSSEVSRGNLKYLWDFGDGVTTSTYSSSIVAHSYEKAGLYSITLYVESDYGCRDSSTVEIGVITEVVSAFDVNDTIQCFKGNEFVFLTKSTGPQGKLRHFWDFGDNVTIGTVTATHSYASSGTYTVTLAIGHISGCTDTSSFNVVVYPTPKVKFSVNDSSQTLTGHEFIFTNLTTISSGELGYIWKFGDTSALTTLVNPRHVYDTTGTYTVTLVSTELTTGCLDTSALSMYVFGTVDANFSINDTLQCYEGNEFIFSNDSKINGGEMMYMWDFGDGSISEDESVSYVYQIPGLYKVRLLVTGTAGGSDSASIYVRVSPMPEVYFTINDSIQCFPVNKFNFINKTTINKDPDPTYLWDLGDSTSSVLKNIVGYKYKKEGLYNVKLIATSLYGCQDSLTRPVEIGALTQGVKYDSVVTRKNFETQLEARFYDEATYLWVPSIYLSQSDTTNPVFYGDVATQFKIRIIDRYGCIFYDTVKVLFADKSDIYVPNGFTPNVDKLNDKFRPLLINIKELKYFKIFNRWGIQIYTTSDRKGGWDGTYKGTLQPMDTYTWIAVGVDIDGKTISKSGNFILIK